MTWGEDGVPAFSSGNFSERNNELSANLAAETSPEAVLTGHESFGLIQITAQQVRAAFAKFNKPVIICRDTEDPANGHVLICGKPSQGVKAQLKGAARWVDGHWPAKPSEAS